MNLQSIVEYCLAKEGAYLEFPFGPIPAVIKVNGRIFTEVYDRETKPQITLKCDPVLAVMLRHKYPGTVIPGYHVINRNKSYWNTVLLNQGDVPETEIFDMIDHSCDEVLKKLKKRNPAKPGV